MTRQAFGRTIMRIGRVLAVFTGLALLVACATAPTTQQPVRVLFIGNSLTYVGNLPAVFDAWANRSGRSVHSDMLVKGGATLSERLADGTAERALRDGAYDIVVLQERGGDFLDAFGPDSSKQADNALRELTSLARRLHARAVLLGSYQSVPEVSRAIVDAESSAASKYSVTYIPVSDGFQQAIAEFPSDNWLFKDGMHPGHDLTLLKAARLYQALFDASASAGELVVSAPMYPPSAHFPIEVVDSGTFEAVDTELDHTHVYSEEVVSTVMKLAGKTPLPNPRSD